MNRIFNDLCENVYPVIKKYFWIDLIVTDIPYILSSSKPGKSDLMSLQKYNSDDYQDITNGIDINFHLYEMHLQLILI